MTTATMANPLEHASRLLCLPSHRLQVVGHDLDGSPQGPKRVLFWNPPLTKASLLAQGKLDLRSVPEAEVRAAVQPPGPQREERGICASIVLVDAGWRVEQGSPLRMTSGVAPLWG